MESYCYKISRERKKENTWVVQSQIHILWLRENSSRNTSKVQTMNPTFLSARYYVDYDYEYLPSADNR